MIIFSCLFSYAFLSVYPSALCIHSCSFSLTPNAEDKGLHNKSKLIVSLPITNIDERLPVLLS